MTAPSTPPVPVVVVPREPSGSMQAAGRDALEPYVGILKQPVEDQWHLARLVYAAMLSASPEAIGGGSLGSSLRDTQPGADGAVVARLEEMAGWLERGDEGADGSVMLAASVAQEHSADLRTLLAEYRQAVRDWNRSRDDGSLPPADLVPLAWRDGIIDVRTGTPHYFGEDVEHPDWTEEEIDALTERHIKAFRADLRTILSGPLTEALAALSAATPVQRGGEGSHE